MARHFTAASSEKITLALGALGFTGAASIVAVCKSASDGVTTPQIIQAGSSTNRYALRRNVANTLRCTVGATNLDSTLTFTVADGWCLVGWSKGAGTVTPRFHKVVLSTLVATHEAAGGTAADDTPVTSAFIGSNQVPANFWDGDIAAIGIYNANLSDAENEDIARSWLRMDRTDGKGWWMLNQESVGQTLFDRTGGGANQTAITGTTIATTEPGEPFQGYLPPPHPEFIYLRKNR